MKTRGSWAKVITYVSVAGLVCALLLLTALGGGGRRIQQAGIGRSPAAANGVPQPVPAQRNPKWIEAYGKLPLSFEENLGQTAREVRFVSHGNGYELFLTPQEAVLALRANKPLDLSPLHRTASLRALSKVRRASQMTAIRMHLEGANPEPQIAGTDRLTTKVNYFIGNDPKKWHTDVPSYGRVKYTGVYPGIDLVFYGNQRRLEYDFVIAPGADPKAIALKVDGARKMRVNLHGDLVLGAAGGEVELRKPVIYQNIKGERREIAGRYVFSRDHRVTFAVGSYNRSEPLILDPVLNYSTYLGGSSDDVGSGIAVDASGNAFIAGQTFSTNFPPGTNGAVSPAPSPNSGAAFVAELNPAGTQLLYSAYLAGTTTSPGDIAFAVAVDASGKVYLTGTTFATDFPTKNGLAISGNAVTGTAFVTKLDPTVSGSGLASVIYSTFLGGTGGEHGNAIETDASGSAYVAGLTDSTNFPTQNAFQSSPNNLSGTAFLTRIDTTPTGNASLAYSTYLGGTGTNSANFLGFGDEAFGVAVDSSHNAYVTGQTSSNDPTLTTTTAYQTTPPAGNTQASVFVSRIDTTMSGVGSLIYSTYLAGSTLDLGNAIALGPSNVAYVTGTTGSTDFPFPGATTGAFDTTGSASGKAFVTLVDTSKSGSNSVPYSTYLGGTGSDTGFGIRADGSGNAYVVGTATSTDFAGAGTLKRLGAFQPTLKNTFGSPFIAKLNPRGNGSADLLYATYFGGSGDGTHTDQGFGIAIDASNPPNAYLTGQTFSADMTVVSGLPSGGSLKPPSDAFVAKLALIPTVVVTPSPFDFQTQPVGAMSTPQTFTLTNNTSATVTFTTIAAVGVSPAANTDFAVASDACSPSVAAGAQCTVTVTFTPAAAGLRTGTLVFTDSDVNSPQNVSLSGTGSASAPGVGLAPTSLAFGNQVLNTTSAAKTVTLTNTGTAALTINSIAASGDFAISNNPCGAGLAAGANCIISVTFTPTALGARTGTLTITDNAGGSPHTAPLTGNGVNAADFTVAASAPVPPTVKAGASAVITVTVTPIGGFSSAVTVTCAEPAGLTLSTCTASPGSVTPNGAAITTQVTVTTTAPSLMIPPYSIPNRPLPIRQIIPLLLAFILLFLIPTAKKFRLRLAMATAMVAFLVLAGCSGPKAPVKPGTTPGTYSLTITGTSGATVHSAPAVSLTVN
jgi:ASPM-SPD-2-Hydin domain-containing protein/beta-propeller repeat-containing protein